MSQRAAFVKTGNQATTEEVTKWAWSFSLTGSDCASCQDDGSLASKTSAFPSATWERGYENLEDLVARSHFRPAVTPFPRDEVGGFTAESAEEDFGSGASALCALCG